MTSMSRTAKRASGFGLRTALGLLASLAPACAPSDFDGLIPRGGSGDPSTACDAGDRACALIGDAGHSMVADAQADVEADSGSPAADAGAAQDAAPAPPADAGACGAASACTPMTVATDSEACGNCKSGKRSRTRTCGPDCSWGQWSAWTDCTGARGCAPGDTQACDPVDSCGVRVCSDQCEWDDTCVPKPGAECVRRRVYYEGDKKIVQEEGSMYMCCPEGGKWSFCQPDTCRWSDSCAACSPAYCEC